MEIKIIENNNQVEIKIIGRLDTIAAADLNKAIEPFLNAGEIHMQIDCNEMNYIASSGLRTLHTLHKELGKAGGSLLIAGVQPTVMQVLQMTGFDTFLNIK